jgi:hypothetical protein
MKRYRRFRVTPLQLQQIAHYRDAAKRIQRVLSDMFARYDLAREEAAKEKEKCEMLN